MPSFTMHIAIAKEYIRKHKDNIENVNEFIKGNLAPDLTDNKSITHYGEWGRDKTKIVFENFIKDEKIDFSKDFYKGYLLHLLADDFTYNHILKEEFDKVRNDKAHNIVYEEFYYLNRILIPKYKINIIPEEVKKFAEGKDGEYKYLNVTKIIDMIDKISSINIEEQITNIRKNGKTKYNYEEV